MASARPLQLLSEPEPVDVEIDSPAGSRIFRPDASRDQSDLSHHRTGAGEQFSVQFHWNHCQHRSRCYIGFERIETVWWQAAGKVHRDYCRLETSAGSCFWLFRDSHNRWFLHGVFE